MVRGVEKFKDYFKEYAGQYVFIGGAACDILLGNMGEDFRATKDLDIVLIIEALNERFISTFISFVEAGGYEHIDKGTGENQFFRFSKPKDPTFPHMIELFSKKPEYLGNAMKRLGPIYISDEVVSLSAILLDDEYYELLRTGVTVIDEISVLDLKHIILFKMKAWLDLTNRKNTGERIDSKDIRKHKNDIFRLAGNLDRDDRIFISGQIRKDVEKFIESVKNDSVDLKNLGIRNATYSELLGMIAECYGL
ncbi:MAG: hypothetical protein KH828_00490 [Clostridiales bacterium]|nr:hypothetical protein [Clostridiales bacterium]